MNENNIYDDTLFYILKECKTLPAFFDVVFGFLRRRTDFYHVTNDPKSPVGLPPGWAENFVKQSFYKWKPKDTSEPHILKDSQVPQPITETEVVAEDVSNPPIASNTERSTISTPVRVESKFLSSESYNGAVFDNYSWSQTITEIDISVRLPENVATKNLLVDISSQKLHVAFKGTDAVLLSGDLCHKVKHNDVLWAVENRKLQIHLEKVQEMWWDCLLQNEPKLDVSKIDCSRPFEELPEDAQAKIEELAWNQERKRLGLPTSNEMSMHETLKKAWNAEGSPFSGPFDPSKVRIN